MNALMIKTVVVQVEKRFVDNHGEISHSICPTLDPPHSTEVKQNRGVIPYVESSFI